MGKHSKPVLPLVSSAAYVETRKAFLHNAQMKSHLWQRIKLARTNAGMTQEQVGVKLGISRAAVAQWEAVQEEKRTTPSRDNLKDFARVTGAPLAWLYDDDSDLAVPASRSVSVISEIESEDGYVRVRQLDAEAGMGSEIENVDAPEVIRAIDFESSYIRSIVGYMPPPGRLCLIAGRGDSMMPLIQPGDTVVVDTGVTTFDGDGVYLINMGNGHQIKRLLDRGVIHVASENPSYGAPFPIPDGTLIGGKVYLRNRIDRFN